MKDLNPDFLIILSTVIILCLVLMMVLIYVGFLRKKSQLLLKQKAEQANFERELALSQIEIKEQTLNYVGQELHDDLGQKLSVAKLLTNRINFSESSNAENIKEIQSILAECIADVRNLSKNFITGNVAYFGLIDSLEREISRLKKLGFIQVSFSFNNHDVDVNSQHSVILFRIIQECINNSLKHSKAKKMIISVEDSADFIHMKVSDNGTGISPETSSYGSGLRNMISRAKMINSKFIIHTANGQGTEIEIIYPKQQ